MVGWVWFHRLFPGRRLTLLWLLVLISRLFWGSSLHAAHRHSSLMFWLCCDTHGVLDIVFSVLPLWVFLTSQSSRHPWLGTQVVSPLELVRASPSCWQGWLRNVLAWVTAVLRPL